MMSSSEATPPSRRSHTKSRKGCKTCKRRHIRCDESYPQCRNCTKHQARCDYMDVQSNEESAAQSSSSSGLWSSEIDSLATQWRSRRKASIGDISVDLTRSEYDYSQLDLRMLYYVLQRCQPKAWDTFTVQSYIDARTLGLSNDHTFLMHAVMGFTASAMAFEQDSTEAKSIAYHYRGQALQGLVTATQALTPHNTDAVLLASVILGWQATDWQSRLSFVCGIQTVMSFSKAYQDVSVLPDVIEEQRSQSFEASRVVKTNTNTQQFHQDRAKRLHNIAISLDELLLCLDGGDGRVRKFLDKLLDYIRRLQTARPASTPEEEFNHLHAFRKWLFWIPPIILGSPARNISLVMLTYLYATALELIHVFPSVTNPFGPNLAVAPLRAILQYIDSRTQGAQGNQDITRTQAMLNWPRMALSTYDSERSLQTMQHPLPFLEGAQEGFAFTADEVAYRPHESPAFGLPTELGPGWSESSSSAGATPFLRTPRHMASDFDESYTSAGEGFLDPAYLHDPQEEGSGQTASDPYVMQHDVLTQPQSNSNPRERHVADYKTLLERLRRTKASTAQNDSVSRA